VIDLVIPCMSISSNLDEYTGESRYLEVHGTVAKFRVIRNLT